MIASILFLVSAAVVLYVTLGYPLVLALYRKSGPQIQKKFLPRSVSVLIAVHNGESFLRRKLESILAQDYPQDLLEILVVSDGSTDSTEAIAAEFAPRVQLLRVARGGKAAALNQAIPKLQGEILLLTDVRQPLAPDCLHHLIACFSDPSVGAVSAELRVLGGERREESDMELYWRYDVWIRKRMSLIGSTFGANGPCYAMRRKLAGPIPPDTLLDDVALLLPALFSGYRLILEPAANVFDFPTALKTEFRRKMRTLAGLWQVYVRHPALLGPSNPMWFHFLSQKFGRLLMPYGLLGVTLSAPWLPGFLALPAVVGLLLFYGFAALDLILPQTFFLKKLSSPMRSFLVLNMASLGAISVFFVPPQRLWKITTVSRPASLPPYETAPAAESPQPVEDPPR